MRQAFDENGHKNNKKITRKLTDFRVAQEALVFFEGKGSSW